MSPQRIAIPTARGLGRSARSVLSLAVSQAFRRTCGDVTPQSQRRSVMVRARPAGDLNLSEVKDHY